MLEPLYLRTNLSAARIEAAVLGMLMLAEDECRPRDRRVILFLASKDFSDPRHAILYETIRWLSDQDLACDFITVLHRLEERGLKEEAGGGVYPFELLDGVGTTTLLLQYTTILKYNSVRRQLSTASENVQHVVDGPGDDGPAERVEQARALLQKVLLDNPLEAEDDGEKTMRRLREALSPELLVEYPTEYGFPVLDAMTSGGLHAGELVVLAARTSVGKSAFALQIALHASLVQGKQVLFVTLEMGMTEVLARALSQRCEIPHGAVRARNFSSEERERAEGFKALLASGKFRILDESHLTIEKILARAASLADQPGLDLLVVDYLGLLPLSGKGTRAEDIGELTHSFKQAAKELNLSVLLLAQLNRASEKEERKPRLSDLRSSGDIEQDADVVLFLHRKEATPPAAGLVPETTLMIAKQRAGPLDDIPLLFEGHYVRFLSSTPRTGG